MVIVAQLGARMHYAVPAILQRAGMLERLYTDTYARRLPTPLRSLASLYATPSLRRWLARVPVDVPKNKITSFDAMGLEYKWRLKRSASPESATEAYLWVGKAFCRRIIRRGLGNASCVYTFNSAGLELLRYARAQGAFTVMEQTMAPGVVEKELLEKEEADFPEWLPAREPDSLQRAFREREQMEWETADLILCGSQFVRDGIRAAGGPVDRCRIVPYGVRPPDAFTPRDARRGPLRVLTVGAVGLRKGAQYVLGAARSLMGRADFRMVGALDVTTQAKNLLREHVTLAGPVPRSQMHEQFAWADVFLLPSLCEGSATACYEALSYGLPVITTPNAGSVVRDGLDGFIVPARDAQAIADRVERFVDDRDLWAEMSANALSRAADFTLEKYGERLLSVLGAAGSQQATDRINVRTVTTDGLSATSPVLESQHIESSLPTRQLGKRRNSTTDPRRLVWINNIPTPYRLHLFEAIRIQSERRGVKFEGRFMAARMGARRFHEDLPSTRGSYPVERGLQFQHKEFITHLNVPLIFQMLLDPPEVLIVCGWSELTSILLILCARLRKARPKILMWAEANRHSMQLGSRPFSLFRRNLCDRCDALVVPGEIARDTVRNNVGVTSPRVILLPNLVSETVFSEKVFESRTRRAAIRDELGLLKENRVIVCCARIHEKQKGLQQFLESVKDLWPSWLTMCIAGDGPDAKGLSHWIDRNLSSSKVRLMGQLRSSRLVDLLAAADVFVLPSILDPNPLSVIEALWAGLPIMLSDRCGNWPEAVDAGKNGWIFDSSKREAVRTAFRAMIETDSERLTVMGKASHEIALERFSTEKCVQSFLEQLETL